MLGINFILDKLLFSTDLIRFSNISKTKTLAPSEIFINQGKMFRKVFFISKGIIRAFAISDTGEEKTLFFRFEGQFGGLAECLFENNNARYTWQAITECEIIEVDFDEVEKISEINPDVNKVRNVFARQLILEVTKRLESFVLEKPETRYLNLINQKPEIFHHVPDKYIASFIGITPVSLSRIRKRLAANKK